MAEQLDGTQAGGPSEEGQAAQSMVEAAQDVGQDMSRPSTPAGGLDLLRNVNLTLTVELGRARMKISEILHLGGGSVVELQKLANEPVDLLVNDTLFARGEVVVVEDHFAVKITELVDNGALDQFS